MRQVCFSSRNEATASSDQQRKASAESRAAMRGFSAHKAAEDVDSTQFRRYNKRTGYGYMVEDVIYPFCPLMDKKYIIRSAARAAGASIGAVTGMAVGSRICPGVGTVIGGVVGGLLGAEAGSKVASKCLR